MKNKVYIWHAKEDAEMASKLCLSLKRHGFIPWSPDLNLLPGQNKKLETKKAIRESAAFLALLSNLSISQIGPFQVELKTAMEKSENHPTGDIFILPILLEDCELPENIRDLKSADFTENYENGLKRVLDSLNLKIGGREYETPPAHEQLYMKKLICFSYDRDRLSDKIFLKNLTRKFEDFQISRHAHIWWDEMIPDGCDWDSETYEKFKNADVYIVLASSGYERNRYILDFEWPVIERRTKAKEAKLFWFPIDREPKEFCGPTNLSHFLTSARLTVSWIDTSPRDRDECINSLANEVALILDSPHKREPASQFENPRKIEAEYLSALRKQCDALPKTDRYLPMNKLYVRLKADERPPEELRASQEVQREEIEYGKTIRGNSPVNIIANHVKKLKQKPDNPLQATYRFDDDTLENVFMKNRFLVIRGGPGSGKTVLCWRLSSCLGEGWRNEFNSGSPNRGRCLTDVGPARLPILIPIREYAQAFHQDGHNLSLADFIGRHVSNDDPKDAGRFREFLLEQLNLNRAAVFLDGLDEVPVIIRFDVVDRIQDFLETYILPTVMEDTEPGDTGGNQLVVTSRLAGYELAPITDPIFRHFEIRPFDEEAIEAYCRHWAKIRFSRHRHRIGAISDELVRCVLRDSTAAVKELSQTPLLLQVLCELAAPMAQADEPSDLEKPQPLPRCRAEIYQQAIREMANRWQYAYGQLAEQDEHLKRLLAPGEVETLLSLVATEIHESEVGRSATEEELRDWLEMGIDLLTQKPAYGLDPSTVTRITDSLIELLRTHVGVISEKAPSVFEFHHLTFQEYLVGKSMCFDPIDSTWKSPVFIAQELAERVLNPRWREPALFAFGQLGLDIDNCGNVPDPIDILMHMRKFWHQEHADCTEEEAAILATLFAQELPDEKIQQVAGIVVHDLVTCYAKWGADDQFESIREPLVNALVKLRSRAAEADESIRFTSFDNSLISIMKEDHKIIAPLAYIIANRAWFSRPMMQALTNLRQWDNADWGWPIHKTLRAAVIGKDWEPTVLDEFDPPDPESSSVRERWNYAVALESWRSSKQEERERCLPKLADFPQFCNLIKTHMADLRQNHCILRAIMALCGGIKDVQAARWIREYHDIVIFLSKHSAIRESLINRNPQDFLPRWGATDPIYNMAVYLDNNQEGRKSLIDEPVVFSHEWICHDPGSQISEAINSIFRAGKGSWNSLQELFRDLALNGSDPDIAAESLVALLAMGQVTFNDIRIENQKALEWHLDRVCDELRDAVIRFGQQKEKKPEKKNSSSEEEKCVAPDTLWSILDIMLPRLPDHEAAAIFRIAMRTLIAACDMPVAPNLKIKAQPNSLLFFAVEGEHWACGFSQFGDDPVYNFAVLLDTKKFPDDPSIVLQQLEAIIEAENFRFVRCNREIKNVRDGLNGSFDRMLDLLMGLCDAAGRMRSNFPAGFFWEATKGFLNKHNNPQANKLLIFAEYLGPEEMVGFPFNNQELKRIRKQYFTGNQSDSQDFECRDIFPQFHPLIFEFQNDFKYAIRLCRDDKISTSDGWKAFTIFAACHVLRSNYQFEKSPDILWQELRDATENNQSNIAEAVEAFVAQYYSGGLMLTDTAADSLERLVRLNNIDAISCLVPLIDQVTTGMISRLEEWSLWSFDDKAMSNSKELLSKHSALLLAEKSVEFQTDWISPICDLASCGDDISRARAELVLGGPYRHIRRGIRRRRLSSIGISALLEILNRHLKMSTFDSHDRILSRFIDDLHIDDPINLKSILTQKEGNVYFRILWLRCPTWSKESLEEIAEWLEHNPKYWDSSLLIGYGCLLDYQKDEIPDSLHKTIYNYSSSNQSMIHVLGEDESYEAIVMVCAESSAKNCKSLDDAIRSVKKNLINQVREQLAPNETTQAEWRAICHMLGLSACQQLNTPPPENCYEFVEPNLNSEVFFEISLHWLNDALLEWRKSSGKKDWLCTPQDVFIERVTNALLSVMTILTERWRDKFVQILKTDRYPKLQQNIVHAAMRHWKTRARMAALTLLSRLPDPIAQDIAAVYHSAVHDDVLVRERALMLLPHFRNFTAGSEFVSQALDAINGYKPASVVLADAYLLARMLEQNLIMSPEEQRTVLHALRLSTKALRNKRAIGQLVGAGDQNSPKQLIADKRLDHELLAVLGNIYGRFTMKGVSRF